MPLTPTPLNNVNSFENKTVLPKLLSSPTFTPQPIFDKTILKGTLNEPYRADGIPKTAQWLSGEGAGSWFSISPYENEKYIISRFSPSGDLECEGEFIIRNNLPFNIKQPFRFNYLSHCREVRIRQKTHLIEFERE